MTDFTPFDQTSFDQLLRGHAGLLEDSVHDRWVRAQALFEERAYREAGCPPREGFRDHFDYRRSSNERLAVQLVEVLAFFVVVFVVHNFIFLMKSLIVVIPYS